MKAVVQRVKQASVTIDGNVVGEIKSGLAVLIAFAESDNIETIKWFANKLMNQRIFNDENDKLNLSLLDTKGELLLVSNFTVYGDTRKGFRPSFTASASPSRAEEIYNEFVQYVKDNYEVNVQTGEFGADMDVAIVNDGPVTIIIEK